MKFCLIQIVTRYCYLYYISRIDYWNDFQDYVVFNAHRVYGPVPLPHDQLAVQEINLNTSIVLLQ